MPRMSFRLLAACALVTVAGFASTPAPAQDGVTVKEAWARASPGAATTGAAYVTLMGADQPDSLVGASTPVAATAEVHESTSENGIMKMRPVKSVPVPPHRLVAMTPGSYHIMLTGLKHPLVAGQSFPLTLTFDHTAPLTVDVKVRAMGRGTTTSEHDHMKM